MLTRKIMLQELKKLSYGNLKNEAAVTWKKIVGLIRKNILQ